MRLWEHRFWNLKSYRSYFAFGIFITHNRIDHSLNGESTPNATALLPRIGDIPS